MSLSEKEFVDKVFAIENRFEILGIVAVDTIVIAIVCMALSAVHVNLIVFGFIFAVIGGIFVWIGLAAGYFPVMNFRKAYMSSYSYEELDFINKCESRNPLATSNFVKYEHLFIG